MSSVKPAPDCARRVTSSSSIGVEAVRFATIRIRAGVVMRASILRDGPAAAGASCAAGRTDWSPTSPPATTTQLASGTSCHAPLRSPSGSETTRCVWSDTRSSSAIDGYSRRSVGTSVVTKSDRDRPSLE